MSLRFIFFDTETTGINPNQDFIIELAAFDSKYEKSFSTLINPGIPIPPETTLIHHITDDMVKEAPTFEKAINDFHSFCMGEVILVAHNNDAFDKPFLVANHKRFNIPLPNYRYIDSLKWARKYRKDLPKHTLQYLREIYSIEENQAHRALDDSITLSKIFKKMVDDLTPEQVLELMNKPFIMTKMPFGRYQGTNIKELPPFYVEWLKKEGFFEKEANRELKASFEAAGIL